MPNSFDAFFVAKVNDTLWLGDKEASLIYFNHQMYLQGADDVYSFIFKLKDVGEGEQKPEVYVSINHDKKYAVRIESLYFNVTELNIVEEYLSAEFELEVLYKSNEEEEKRISVKEGLINKMRFDYLFCQVDYEIKEGDFEKFGKWNLIDIENKSLDTVYYPPCGSDLNLEFHEGLSEGELVYYLTAAGCRNQFISDHTMINDSTIVIPSGGQTLVGVSYHWEYYENLYFSSLARDTFQIRWEKNLMSLENKNGLKLNYYK